MPHHVGVRWSAAARSATAIALFVAQGCTSDESRVIVRVTDESARAAIASPVDPRILREARSSPSATGAVARSIVRYYAVSDSADSLDAVFRTARDSLNREARSLVGGDRHSIEYGERYDAYMSRVAVATRTREARDRARRRAAALRTQLGANAPDLTRRHADPGQRLRTALDSAARANGTGIVRESVRDGQATLELTPGIWWLAIETDDGLLSDVRRHEVRPGARDTVHIGR
jgi:hypothetical protein